ncbi:L,D-transpeptidase family protein [Clostridium thailandense]|uniref:L,D-transpeptidase family protein n=1 Tax=Clostridium thailandense TaxID=2794346 RepID=UPI00398918AB
MKCRDKAFPIIFLIFGIVLITAISGLSIRKYIKDQNASKEKLQQISLENGKNSKGTSTDQETNKDNFKIFFNKPESTPSRSSIKIYKEKKVLELYADEKLIGRFKIGLGTYTEGNKEKEGDNKIPEGSYYISSKISKTKYTYFMGISYPNVKDAQNGLDKGLIDKSVYNRIKNSIEEKKQPPGNTPLGGEIGIHGGGTEYENTYGSISLSNEDINIIKQYSTIGMSVEIYK